MFQNRVRDGLPSQLVRRSVHKKGPVSRVSPLTYAARNANATLPAMNASALPDDRRRGRRLLPRLRRARVGVPPVYHRRCRNATGCQRLRAPNCPNVAVREGRCREHAPKPWAGSEQRRDRRGVLRGHALQKIRRRRIREAGGRCDCCGGGDRPLVLHHLGELADYLSTLVLCERCHGRQHRSRDP
jgi:hypothetical protein